MNIDTTELARLLSLAQAEFDRFESKEVTRLKEQFLKRHEDMHPFFSGWAFKWGFIPIPQWSYRVFPDFNTLYSHCVLVVDSISNKNKKFSQIDACGTARYYDLDDMEEVARGFAPRFKDMGFFLSTLRDYEQSARASNVSKVALTDWQYMALVLTAGGFVRQARLAILENGNF